MALALGYVLAAASIALLVIYGADESAARMSEQGFLPLDSMTRGIGLGVSSIVLAFAAFFVSRNDPSVPLGGLIIAAGAFIAVGGIMPLITSPDSAAMGGSLLGIGAVIVGLGVIKVVKSR